MHTELIGPISLFIIGLATGAIGSVAGGSVLMTAPLLTSLGMPLQSAIATSRVSSFGANGAGLREFHKAGKVDYRLAWQILFWSVSGSLLGACVMLNMAEKDLERLVGLCMLGMLTFGLLKDRLTIRTSLSSKRSIGYILFFTSGFLGGFFGGQAIVASYLLMNFFNVSPSESIGTRKLVGVIVSCSTILIYASWGTIDWENGTYLLLGSFIGATLSAKWALQRGEETLQWILNASLILLALKMLLF